MADSKQASLTETPEFKAAVAEAVKGILSELQVGQQPATPGDVQFAEHLALAIAQLNEQGVGVGKKVDPSVLKARGDARSKMTDRIIEARKRHEVPAYGLKSKVFLNEQKIDPFWVGPDKTHRQTIIEWSGVPSEAMIPVPGNRAAEDIFDLFKQSIGTNTPYTDERAQRVTAGGLVVHGAPRPSRTTGADDNAKQDIYGEGLRVPHRDGAKQVNILGTVAPAARENQW